MLLRTAAKYISLTLEIKKRNLLSEMEYRVSFFIQFFGMILNDIGWLVVWLMVFLRFPDLNGWTSNELIILQSVTALTWGLIYFFVDGVDEISIYIAEGRLDQFLSLPKNILWQVSVSDTYVTSLGDITFGLFLFFFAKEASIGNFFVFILVAVLGAIVAYSFMLIAHSLTFFFGNFKQAAWSLIGAFSHLTDSPQSIYRGGLKFISMFIFPAFFVGMLPVTIIKNFSWLHLSLLSAAALVIFVIAKKVFFTGLKRYESGNQININM